MARRVFFQQPFSATREAGFRSFRGEIIRQIGPGPPQKFHRLNADFGVISSDSGKLTRAAVLLFHPDRLYLGNAGGLPKGWKVGSLFRKHTSEARNELIAGALYRGGFVETWGRGIEKVCRECEKFGVPRPEYDATESDVMVCLHARSTNSAPGQELSPTPKETTIETTTETTTETATENLSEGTKKVFSAIIQMPTATLNEIAALVGMTRDGVYYHVKILRKEVGLKHEGPTKKGRWVVDRAKEGGVR